MTLSTAQTAAIGALCAVGGFYGYRWWQQRPATTWPTKDAPDAGGTGRIRDAVAVAGEVLDVAERAGEAFGWNEDAGGVEDSPQETA